MLCQASESALLLKIARSAGLLGSSWSEGGPIFFLPFFSLSFCFFCIFVEAAGLFAFWGGHSSSLSSPWVWSRVFCFLHFFSSFPGLDAAGLFIFFAEFSLCCWDFPPLVRGGTSAAFFKRSSSPGNFSKLQTKGSPGLGVSSFFFWVNFFVGVVASLGFLLKILSKTLSGFSPKILNFTFSPISTSLFLFGPDAKAMSPEAPKSSLELPALEKLGLPCPWSPPRASPS